ncbi:MAG: hypothetical protein Sv326_0341 [Candidatus Fermentimicrarchaeum limneticum]|uniref:Uncharacterized protein n=1 Tax=Fermentimicrarchaeum limneticum TaxID=2795018 RepID=A0A7D6BL59_FERL1|nr:MAG: hypothetical protein Sv326_0341 [Candidatus Fermentimicrarchaeum limneticum]
METRDIQTAEASEGALTDQERCTRQFVLTAVLNAKSLSSQLREGLYTAGNVGRKENQSREDEANSLLFPFLLV